MPYFYFFSAYGLKEVGDIPLVEALSMFLIVLGHGFTNRKVQERFQHSGDTVSRWFGIILDVVCRMASDIISPQNPKFRRVPDKIKADYRYWPYFKDCIGAIDVHIYQKGITTQNILAVCDFDMCFTFVWAGWEGKYYLVDAGYPQIKGYLGPYKGKRYHLPDFRRGSQPREKKEIFNYRHSSLRCTIERTFGVWKNRCRMIRQMHNFPMEKQTQKIVASRALHNFIRCHSMTYQEFQPYDDNYIIFLRDNIINSDIIKSNSIPTKP
ncbi:hypothetical protein PRUPE_1G189200 [Prunus persica]|uniref:Uncharacterized protein n=1 Tax=Prunus persica TaxID=3760 RepID=A0A251QZI2_PRUPE|nr:hypothetical protein PRUPE_1G189200 [Prunus persica]